MCEIERPGRPERPPRGRKSDPADEADNQSRAGLKIGSGRHKIIWPDVVFDLNEVESCRSFRGEGYDLVSFSNADRSTRSLNDEEPERREKFPRPHVHFSALVPLPVVPPYPYLCVVIHAL